MKRVSHVFVPASNSDQPGTQWLLFAPVGNQKFFAEPPGQGLHNYPHEILFHEGNQILINKPIQSTNSVLCGFYCFYVAHVIFSSKFLISFKVKDYEMMLSLNI